MIRHIGWLILLLPSLLIAAGDKKVVIVTGASSGMAQAIAERFACEEEYVVYGTTRQEKLLGKHPKGYTLVKMDSGSTSSVNKAISEISELEHQVDLLINCAGYMVLGSVESVDPDQQLLDLFNVNVVGYARTTRAVAPLMRRNGGGRIINITSIQAVEPRGLQESYSATRSAVESLALGQSSYLIDDGIEVLVYEPGATRTNIMASTGLGSHQVEDDKTLGALIPFRDFMSDRLASGMPSQDVAEQVYALARKKAPDFRSFASPAVKERAAAVYVDPTGNSLRQKLRDKYTQFIKEIAG